MTELAPTCPSKFHPLRWTEPLTFSREEVLTVPRGLPGVYALAAFVSSSPFLEIFYVGRSANLQRRLGEHLDGSRTFARHLRHRLSVYFLFAPVFHPVLRAAAEAALIRDLAPIGNSQVPNTPAIHVTPPPTALVEFQR